MGINIGDRIGNLTVVSQKRNSKKRKSYVCKCDCGNIITLGSFELIGNDKRRPRKSCGCMRYKQQGNTVKYKRLYNIWHGMIYRCNYEKHAGYGRYGAVGITVCKEWESSFNTFVEWALNNGYEEHLTIDRIDNGKGYEPSNCRWATYEEQEVNRKMLKNNTTGVTGVYYLKREKRYRSMMRRNGKRYTLGFYDTFEEAVEDKLRAEEYYKENGTLEGVRSVLNYKPKKTKKV